MKAKTESLIGKKYIPCDNSWSVNVTQCGDFLSKAKRAYLAGTQNEERKECTIISEPFQCYTNTTGVTKPKSTHAMIMVDYRKETYMIMYLKECVQ